MKPTAPPSIAACIAASLMSSQVLGRGLEVGAGQRELARRTRLECAELDL
jgi:hypothetical protein